jgi:mannose-6-phosphate isomerase-like protein (cupin superfamily)
MIPPYVAGALLSVASLPPTCPNSRWLVNKEVAQSHALIVGQSTFVSSAAHMLHRHDRVEEFFYVIEGRGTHLVEGGEVAMGPGDIVLRGS